MGERDLDSFDAALTRALREDGRASVNALAGRLGVSRDTVAQRIRVLAETGRMRVAAALDPRFVGHRVLVHGKVAVEGPVAPVARRIAELPEAVFVSLVSGELPLVFESRHGDDEALHAMLARVRGIPGVRGIRVTTYAEVLAGFFVAKQLADIALDPVDHELIALLQRDGRMSFRKLADAVHLAPSSTRARVQRMLDAEVFRISAMTSGGLTGHRIALGVGIAAAGDTEPIRRYILDCPAIDFAAQAHGAHDFIATVVGSASATALGVLEELRALPGVGSLDTWAHYDVVKEAYPRAFAPGAGPVAG